MEKEERERLLALLAKVVDLAKHSPRCAQEQDWENDCDCGLDEAALEVERWRP